MRRLTALATLVLLFAAGCTEGGTVDDGGGDTTAAEESTGPAAPTEPVGLALDPPTGFSAASGEDREVLFAENHVSQVFYVAGAEGGLDKIVVTSYLLSESVDTSSYDSQATIVTDYFKKLDSVISLNNFYPTVVHRQEGIFRYGEKDIDGVEVKWQDHFVFAGPYLVNITCQWDAYYAQIQSACGQVTETFPFPEDWTALAAA